jgi:ABC-type transport system involved in cytochrome c biogenesis permease component
MAIGGAGMLATAGYELLRTDPEEFSTSAMVLLVLAGSACLSFLGTILSAIGSF